MAEYPSKELFGHREHCPALEKLIDDLDGRNGDQYSKRANAHLARCSHCTTELAMLREFEAPKRRNGEEAHVDYIVARLRRNSPTVREPWWKGYFNAKVWGPSIAVVAVLLLMVFIPKREHTGPDLSGGISQYRSGTVVAIAPALIVSEAPREFKWQPIADAAFYTVRIFEVDNTELWSAVEKDARVQVPDSIHGKLTGPKTVFWRVTAANSAGNTIADSGMLRLSVTH